MTVEVQGHVVSLSTEGAPSVRGVAVKIRLEASRCEHFVTIYASEAEVAMYRPGMPVILQVRPNLPANGTVGGSSG